MRHLPVPAGESWGRHWSARFVGMEGTSETVCQRNGRAWNFQRNRTYKRPVKRNLVDVISRFAQGTIRTGNIAWAFGLIRETVIGSKRKEPARVVYWGEWGDANLKRGDDTEARF